VFVGKYQNFRCTAEQNTELLFTIQKFFAARLNKMLPMVAMSKTAQVLHIQRKMLGIGRTNDLQNLPLQTRKRLKRSNTPRHVLENRLKSWVLDERCAIAWELFSFTADIQTVLLARPHTPPPPPPRELTELKPIWVEILGMFLLTVVQKTPSFSRFKGDKIVKNLPTEAQIDCICSAARENLGVYHKSNIKLNLFILPRSEIFLEFANKNKSN
jgi:hypothetical protein